jgi:hypothetical protein
MQIFWHVFTKIFIPAAQKDGLDSQFGHRRKLWVG